MVVCVFGCVRLYPVGITVQRRTIKDIILQNYHVPAGVSGQTVALTYFHLDSPINSNLKSVQCYSLLTVPSTLPSDIGPGLSLPPGKKCRGVYGSTAL